MGAVMVFVAVVMSADLDTRFQTAIASDLPSFLVNPTGGSRSARRSPATSARKRPRGAAERGRAGGWRRPWRAALPRPGSGLHATPAVVQHRRRGAVDREPARGQVVLIDFWTYTCINCIRTLPYLRRGTRSTAGRPDDRRRPLARVRVREGRRQRRRRDRRQRTRYPVVQDNELGTWSLREPVLARQIPDRRRWQRPLRPLRRGRLRRDREAIRTLLAEAGDENLGAADRASDAASTRGSRRPRPTSAPCAPRATSNGRLPRHDDFGSPSRRDRGSPQRVRLGGQLGIDDEGRGGLGARRSICVSGAQGVFLVLGSEDGPAEARVLLDGEPIRTATRARTSTAASRVGGQRLYRSSTCPAALPPGGPARWPARHFG